MRKIISLEEKDNKTKRNQLIIGGVLILIMIFSTVGYALGDKEDKEEDKKEYNGIEFIKDSSGYWYFEIQGQQFTIINNPENISKISFLSYLTLNNYLNKPLYFIGDIGEGSSEISRNLIERFVLRVQQACLEKENCTGNFPVKNCSSDNLIVFKEVLNNETERMYQEEKCVFIFAKSENQSKYADKFLFKLLGI